MIGEILGSIGALLLVLGLVLAMAWLMKRFGFTPGMPAKTGATKEIEILESKMIDARNRLVVTRWRGEDYLIAAGMESTQLIDKKPAKAQDSDES